MARVRIVTLNTWRQRAVGLLGRRRIRDDLVVRLTPCRAVHTFGMHFALTVVFLDRRGDVRRIITRLPPGRVAWCGGAASVLEMPCPSDGSANRLAWRAVNASRS